MTASTLPAYDLAIDELRVALTYSGAVIDLTPIIAVVVPNKAVSTVAPLPSKVEAPPAPSKEEEVAPVPKAVAAKAADDDDDDDFDVFGDDDDADGGDATAAATTDTKEEGATESRAEMLSRLKKEAELRTIAKEAKQRTLVAIEIKPWDVEQDLLLLFKKISETITQDGLKWAENCNLADVAFGIKKIQTTFTMGATKYVFSML
jgi:translation elongation factor EF-1beta